MKSSGRGIASMTFYEIEFPLADLNSETVETALLELGASSITFVDRGDEPVLEPLPGEIRLWSDTLVRALFQYSSDAAVPVRPTAAGTATVASPVASPDTATVASPVASPDTAAFAAAAAPS